LPRSGIVMITQTVTPMKPGCVLVASEKRLFRTCIHRDIRAAEFGCVECVSSRLLHWNVTGNDGDCGDANVRRAQRHDESDCVIGGRVCIDQKLARHGR
jgi:hypothetical protein